MVTAVQAIQKQDAVLKNSLGFMGKLATLVSSIWIGNKVADKVMKPSDSNTTLVILDQPGEEEEVGEKKLSTFQKCKQDVCKTRDAIVAQAEAHPYVTSAMAGTMVGLAVLGVRHYLGASTSVVAPAVDAVVVVVGPSERPPFTPPGNGGTGGPPPSTSPAVTEIASVKPKAIGKRGWLVVAGVVGVVFVKFVVPVVMKTMIDWAGMGARIPTPINHRELPAIVQPPVRVSRSVQDEILARTSHTLEYRKALAKGLDARNNKFLENDRIEAASTMKVREGYFEAQKSESAPPPAKPVPARVTPQPRVHRFRRWR